MSKGRGFIKEEKREVGKEKNVFSLISYLLRRYDLASDAWEAENLAPGMTRAALQPYRDALWAVADCALNSCP